MTFGGRHIRIGLLRSAAVIGGLFSGVSVLAGTRVLTGVDVPGYVVLPWLVVYNVGAGLFGVAVGVGLWLVLLSQHGLSLQEPTYAAGSHRGSGAVSRGFQKGGFSLYPTGVPKAHLRGPRGESWAHDALCACWLVC